MTKPECVSKIEEYFYLTNSEYLDRRSGNKYLLTGFHVKENHQKEGRFLVQASFKNLIIAIYEPPMLENLDELINGDRFQRIRIAPLIS